MVDRTGRFRLEDPNEIRCEERFVLGEVEAVRPGDRRTHAAESGDKGADHHGIADGVGTGMLGGDPYQSFREASPRVNLLGGERCGMRRWGHLHVRVVYPARALLSTVILLALIMPQTLLDGPRRSA